MAMMMVARHLPKKKSTTMTTNNRMMRIVSSKLSMVLVMLSELSTSTFSFTSAGSERWMSGSSFKTFLQICTVLAPVCFWMMTIAPRSPSVYDSCIRSCRVSFTVATSFRNTFLLA